MAEPEMTPEQQQALKEKLEQMSPEELKEFQKKQCIFCHIVSGKVSAKKVYEDEQVIAVLDINPGNPGHILLMPKEHHMIMPQLPDDELRHIFMVTKHLSNVLLRTLEVRGTNIIIANGPAAGQRAQHFMVHIIPRKEGDGIEFTLPSKTHADDELTEIGEKVKAKLNEILGVEEKPKVATDILSDIKMDEEVPEKAEEQSPAEPVKEKEEENKEPEESDDEEPKESPDKDEDEESPDKDEDPEEDGSDEETPDEVDLDSISKVLNG